MQSNIPSDNNSTLGRMAIAKYFDWSVIRFCGLGQFSMQIGLVIVPDSLISAKAFDKPPLD